MRMEQRQLLTPRMIQSMEILQLPLQALEERIEQELVANPVLEMRDGETDGDAVVETPTEGPDVPEPRNEGEETLVVQEQGNDSQDDFDRLERISSQMLLDLLEVPQRNRTAGTYRRLARVMAELGWTAVRVRDLTRGGYKEQVRG